MATLKSYETQIISAHLIRYPQLSKFSCLWGFGFVSSIILALYYCPDTTSAYSSIARIVRNISYGWVFRYLHLNGASLLFLAVYLHILRGFYQQFFYSLRELWWLSGMVIFVLVMATTFMGYVPP
jgi:quinol-cytochrome oxidoreductase complex cytochrome b subunit